MEYLKGIYVFALMLLVFSFLVPKESYKTYIQFFIGIFLFVVLLNPVLGVLDHSYGETVQEIFEDLGQKLDGTYSYQEGDIYEIFVSEGEGE